MKALKHIENAHNLYQERNKLYGDSYHRFGRAMDALMPNGITVKGTADWNRLGVIVQIMNKLTRYTQDFNSPHEDSVSDMIVYSAMLQELDDIRREEHDDIPYQSFGAEA